MPGFCRTDQCGHLTITAYSLPGTVTSGPASLDVEPGMAGRGWMAQGGLAGGGGEGREAGWVKGRRVNRERE